MRTTLSIAFSLLLASCNTFNKSLDNENKYTNLPNKYQTDYLIRIPEGKYFEIGTAYGYKNLHGDTVIPIGKYSYCFTDTFKNFAVVAKPDTSSFELIAIDRNENLLYEVYFFDNGPDYIQDGLFRIMRNGKIGYADAKGMVIIEPQFLSANPFTDGKAQVSLKCKLVKDSTDEHTRIESTEWFYIDKKGNKVED